MGIRPSEIRPNGYKPILQSKGADTKKKDHKPSYTAYRVHTSKKANDFQIFQHFHSFWQVLLVQQQQQPVKALRFTMDIINSGLETEQPIRVHVYYLTWWTWCLAPPLQFPDTRSSRKIRYSECSGI